LDENASFDVLVDKIPTKFGMAVAPAT